MIRIVTKYEDILDVLNYYSSYLESLRTGRANSVEIAKKFGAHGTVLEYCDSNCRMGFCAFYHNDLREGKAFLSMIAVSTDFKGKGYGSQLLNKVEEISKDSGMRSVSLEVRADNYRAIQFYSRHGYMTVNRQSGYSIFMKKIL